MPSLFNDPAPGNPPGKPSSSAAKPISIGQLVTRIKGAINEGLPGKIHVVGEVSNLSDRNHWFFSLKDDQAAIRSVMFASAARAVRFPVRDGIEVVATGRVDVYPAQGQVQFYVDRLEPVGQGALELELRRLIAELREQGYMDEAHKLPLPAVPSRIAVVTSRSAAALQDVIDTAGRRWPGCELLLYDVRVQGEAAAPEIANALTQISKHHESRGIDAVILTRGGGSIEDLWAFNERVVADAVFGCSVPIVAAIGHETDVTIAELVADHRCATPTQAAMTLVPDREALTQQVDQLDHRLGLMLKRRAELSRQRLRAIERHALFSRPGRLLEDASQRLTAVDKRLSAALPRVVGAQRDKVAALQRHLDAIGPAQVLKRGYTYTTGDDGQVLRSADDAKTQDKLTTVFADGKVQSQVQVGRGDTPPKVKPKAGPSGPSAKPRAKHRAKKNPKPSGPGLFGE